MKLFTPHENTIQEFDRECIFEETLKKSSALAKQLQKCQSRKRCCYVLGMGAQPKSLASEIGELAGAKIVFSKSVIPSYLAPLRFFIASFRFLVRIDDYDSLEQAFSMLVDGSMAGIYIFSENEEASFIAAVCSSDVDGRHDFGVKNDPSYVIYLVDSDNLESHTGCYEILSIGREVPDAIQAALKGQSTTDS